MSTTNAAAKSRRWTREESLIVFNLYVRIPFKDSNKAHPDVRHFARLVDRTPDAVNMKIGNFGSFDPELKKRGITGLRNASRLDQEVWNEFHANWQDRIEESERLIAERERVLEIGSPVPGDAVSPPNRDGGDYPAIRRVREGQQFFRMAILSAYENRCCITGLDLDSLLVASHIKPWAEADKTEKLNPQNGLCLNALHDRAFDRGLIAVADDYSVLVSSRAAQSASRAAGEMLLAYAGRKVHLPSRFTPRPDFLEWHRDNVFVP